LLPLGQSLTNAIVGTATQQVEAEGRKVLRDRIVEKLQDGLRRSLSK
jgi:hypothetical protein